MNPLSSDTLIFLPDVARFALAYLVCVIVPGYALATLARPGAPRSELLAFAVPCAYGLVTVSGLATALLRLPYGLQAYAVIAAPVVLAGALSARWQRRRDRNARTRERDHWWLAPLGVSATYLAALILIYGHDTVPAGYDTLVHISWITRIARAHVYPIALLSNHLGDTGGAFYPPTFHVLTVLLLDLAPMPVYRAAFLNIAAVIILLPAALFTYTRVATGSRKLAGLAVVASLAFEPLPLFTQGLGLYPFIVSLLIVPAVTLALRDGLGRGDYRAAGLAGFLGMGLFYTHPTEFVTVGLLALAIIPDLLTTGRKWLRAAGYSLAIGGVWLLAASPALMAVRRTMVNGAQVEIHAKHDFAASAQTGLASGLDFYTQWVYGRNLSYLLLVAAIIGAAWCVAKRRFLGLVLAQAILSALFLDSVSYNILRPFYVISFPWALWERLSPTHYLFLLPLAAIGIDATRPAVERLLRAKHPAFGALVLSPLVLLGLLAPFGVSTGIAASYAAARAVVAPADFGAVTWLARHAPPGTVVANDFDTPPPNTFDGPLDAGLWLSVLGGPEPLSGPFGALGTIDDRFYLLGHIADDPLPARAARFIDGYHVRYVFYGAKARPGAKRQLHLPLLLAAPRLRLVYTSAPSCHAADGRQWGSCPAGQSYLFALRLVASQ